MLRRNSSEFPFTTNSGKTLSKCEIVCKEDKTAEQIGDNSIAAWAYSSRFAVNNVGTQAGNSDEGEVNIHNGQDLKDLWIHTKNKNDNDAWSNGYLYYTKLSDYDIFPSRYHEFNFRVKTYGSQCKMAFVLLSPSTELVSEEYYEMFLSGVGHIAIRKKLSRVTDHQFNYDEESFTCTDYRNFKISWNSEGRFQVIASDDIIALDWTDSSPLAVNGVGIKTGYGDEGEWIIHHNGNFKGYYCGKANTHGNVSLFRETFGIRILSCAAECSKTVQCLGFNYNSKMQLCQLIKTGKLVSSTISVQWKFYTKCLDEKNICQACFNV